MEKCEALSLYSRAIANLAEELLASRETENCSSRVDQRRVQGIKAFDDRTIMTSLERSSAHRVRRKAHIIRPTRSAQSQHHQWTKTTGMSKGQEERHLMKQYRTAQTQCHESTPRTPQILVNAPKQHILSDTMPGTNLEHRKRVMVGGRSTRCEDDGVSMSGTIAPQEGRSLWRFARCHPTCLRCGLQKALT